MRLLIVEPEDKLATTLTRALEAKGFVIDRIAEPIETFAHMTRHEDEYNLVLLDVTSLDEPQDVIPSLREHKIMVPIIAMTSRHDTNYKVSLLNKGADDYIVRPFSFTELLARINSVLRRAGKTAPAILTFGPIIMDTATRIVTVSGREVPLTLKEYAILECFLKRPKEVITREELFNHIWDFNALTWSNVLDVHIKNLRKKMGARRDVLNLETIRGVGYRLMTPN